MKPISYIILFLLMGWALTIFSQDGTQGIFLTVDDFKAQKLTHASTHTHLKLHESFKKEIIEVKMHDSSCIYKKSEIFGYRDKEGNTYRFYNNRIYPILNPGEKILIYKVANAPPLKGQVQTYSYYFSADATRTIVPLAISNLEKEFKGNQAFLDLLEVHFSNTSNLLEYDDIHKMYKINRLLEMAAGNNNH
jgi:hypothetical protein